MATECLNELKRDDINDIKLPLFLTDKDAVVLSHVKHPRLVKSFAFARTRYLLLLVMPKCIKPITLQGSNQLLKAFLRLRERRINRWSNKILNINGCAHRVRPRFGC